MEGIRKITALALLVALCVTILPIEVSAQQDFKPNPYQEQLPTAAVSSTPSSNSSSKPNTTPSKPAATSTSSSAKSTTAKGSQPSTPAPDPNKKWRLSIENTSSNNVSTRTVETLNYQDTSANTKISFRLTSEGREGILFGNDKLSAYQYMPTSSPSGISPTLFLVTKGTTIKYAALPLMGAIAPSFGIQGPKRPSLVNTTDEAVLNFLKRPDQYVYTQQPLSVAVSTYLGSSRGEINKIDSRTITPTTSDMNSKPTDPLDGRDFIIIGAADFALSATGKKNLGTQLFGFKEDSSDYRGIMEALNAAERNKAVDQGSVSPQDGPKKACSESSSAAGKFIKPLSERPNDTTEGMVQQVKNEFTILQLMKNKYPDKYAEMFNAFKSIYGVSDANGITANNAFNALNFGWLGFGDGKKTDVELYHRFYATSVGEKGGYSDVRPTGTAIAQFAELTTEFGRLTMDSGASTASPVTTLGGGALGTATFYATRNALVKSATAKAAQGAAQATVDAAAKQAAVSSLSELGVASENMAVLSQLSGEAIPAAVEAAEGANLAAGTGSAAAGAGLGITAAAGAIAVGGALAVIGAYYAQAKIADTHALQDAIRFHTAMQVAIYYVGKSNEYNKCLVAHGEHLVTDKVPGFAVVNDDILQALMAHFKNLTENPPMITDVCEKAGDKSGPITQAILRSLCSISVMVIDFVSGRLNDASGLLTKIIGLHMKAS